MKRNVVVIVINVICMLMNFLNYQTIVKQKIYTQEFVDRMKERCASLYVFPSFCSNNYYFINTKRTEHDVFRTLKVPKGTDCWILQSFTQLRISRQHQILPLLKKFLERVSNRHFVVLLHLEGVPQHKCSIAALQGYGKISETTLDSFIGEENNNNNNYYLNHDGGV
ncbi:hypothetical protein RFI_36273, partial [Reticulomyxa filosa]